MECSVDGCVRTDVNKTHLLCHAHDQRRRRGMDLNTPIRDRRKVSWPDCGLEGCSNRSESKTGRWSKLCPIHANQVRAGKEPYMGRVQGKYKECQVPGCSEPFRSSLMCNKHSTRCRMYGLSPARFIELVTSPCAICGCEDMTKSAIDHDHSCCPGEKSCGKCVRGRLCGPCNLGLGAMRDSIPRLEGAIRYLSNWSDKMG